MDVLVKAWMIISDQKVSILYVNTYWKGGMYPMEKVAEKKNQSAIVTFQNVSYICMSFCTSFRMDRDVT